MIHYPNDAVTLKELMTANYNFTVLKDLDGITDITVAPYYAQIDRIFPGSKFILTIREKQSWLRSLKKHWLYEYALNDHDTYPLDYQSHVAITQFLKVAVFGCYNFDEVRMSYVYDLHYKNVLDYFRDRPQDLLVINICAGEGWEKLCPFLNQPPHQEAFPYIHTEKELLAEDYPEEL